MPYLQTILLSIPFNKLPWSRVVFFVVEGLIATSTCKGMIKANMLLYHMVSFKLFKAC